MKSGPILIIKHGALGDFLIGTGVMHALAQHHQDRPLICLTTHPFVPMAEKMGLFSDVWVDDKRSQKSLAAFSCFRSRVLQAGISRIYDLQETDRTQGYKLSLFPHRIEWVGKAWGASHRVPQQALQRPYNRARQILEKIGFSPERALREGLPTVDWMTTKRPSELNKPYACLVPGCSPQRPEKRWPLENFVEIARFMAAQAITPVIIGGPSEKELGLHIKTKVPAAIDLTGKTSFEELAAIFRGACLTLGNDTGPIHLSAIAKCPTFITFDKRTGDPKKHLPPFDHVSSLIVPNFIALTAKMVEKAIGPTMMDQHKNVISQ